MTEDTNTIIADAAQTAAQAVETATTAVVQTEQAKADSWIDREWEKLKAKILADLDVPYKAWLNEKQAAIAEAEAFVKAHLENDKANG